MNLTTETILNAGPIPLLSLIAYFLWQIAKAQTVIMSQHESRDKKLDQIHNDLAENRADTNKLFQKLAGFDGNQRSN